MMEPSGVPVMWTGRPGGPLVVPPGPVEEEGGQLPTGPTLTFTIMFVRSSK